VAENAEVVPVLDVDEDAAAMERGGVPRPGLGEEEDAEGKQGASAEVVVGPADCER